MSTFSDIFVLQMVGMLMDRKFTGALELELDSGPTVVWFSSGNVVKVDHLGMSLKDALREVIWKNIGRLRLNPQSRAAPDIGYETAVEELILEETPAMPATCPMMMHLYLHRTNLKPVQRSKFWDTGFNILLNIKSGGDINSARGKIEENVFWPGFFHLCGNGQVISSYEETLGKFLQGCETHMVDNITKFLGRHIAATYQEKLHEALRNNWPDWKPGGGFDPIYGSAPYRDKANSMQGAMKEIGAPALMQRAYKQSFAALEPMDQTLLTQLCQI